MEEKKEIEERREREVAERKIYYHDLSVYFHAEMMNT